MNELNTASLSASKKLVENGIVLKTDIVWADSVLKTRNNVCVTDYVIPAPSMAEVWRELPADIFIDQHRYRLDMWKVDNELRCCYVAQNARFATEPRCGENPADALIELLIWLKGAGK